MAKLVTMFVVIVCLMHSLLLPSLVHSRVCVSDQITAGLTRNEPCRTMLAPPMKTEPVLHDWSLQLAQIPGHHFSKMDAKAISKAQRDVC